MVKVTIKKLISNIITFVLFSLLILMTIVVISSKSSGGEPEIFGYQLKTVLSGSMEPAFNTGSIIAVQPAENAAALKSGDVITFMQSDNTIVTHRITDIIKNGDQTMYQTKGDNNKDADSQPVLSQNIIGVYTGLTIPYMGYFIDFAKSNMGTAFLLIVPGILLLIYSAYTITVALREVDKRQIGSDSERAV
ncbi:signal peptidase I [Bacillus mangrovi]|uniref:Signal peptidase I n=1 Tax=Metabacillus mangrovi TaxID=1491830 RepID=A0A7X2V5T4_9BACI|nr:signal peptidase I [Metabacillus mangrovi]MTH54524.1 signal peptidase I [Metabacillus mangrovi]